MLSGIFIDGIPVFLNFLDSKYNDFSDFDKLTINKNSTLATLFLKGALSGLR